MSWDATFEVGEKTLWLTCKAGYIDVAITAPNAEPWHRLNDYTPAAEDVFR